MFAQEPEVPGLLGSRLARFNNNALAKSWIDILKIGVRGARDESLYLELGEPSWLARSAILNCSSPGAGT